MKQAEVSTLSKRWVSRTGFTPFLIALSCAGIAWGWLQREQGYISAERGLGYWLGIFGGSMLLLLLTYSLRKRLRSLSRVFTVRVWFQVHMTFGILGPLCILFHSNFRMGSLNSSVALICMLLVAGSGIVGRYLYNRIHHGLYGEKIRLQQTRKDFESLKNEIAKLTVTQRQIDVNDQLFKEIESLIVEHRDKHSFFSLYKSRKKAKKLANRLRLLLKHLEAYHKKNRDKHSDIGKVNKELRDYSSILVKALRKIPGLYFFERFFSLWHFIHIPIFVLMLTTAVTHVIVVHMY